MFEAINEECQVPVSGVFAAAGIQQMVKAVDYPAKDFRRIMDVNVTGALSQSYKVKCERGCSRADAQAPSSLSKRQRAR